jgi:membrane fusion protein (multidrug efflux system)
VAQGQTNAAKEGIRQAQAQVTQAQKEVATAQAKFVQAQKGIFMAQAQLAKAKGGLETASSTGLQTNANRSQYKAAQAAIAQAEANLKDAQLQLSYTNIKAPANGKVGRKTVEVGQRVQPGNPLMAIVSEQPWIVANFKETQLEDVKPGQPVEIKLDTFSHHPFTGHINSISPASGAQFALLPPDNATGNFTKIVQRIPVKVVFDPQSLQGYEPRIVPGMSATVSVAIK